MERRFQFRRREIAPGEGAAPGAPEGPRTLGALIAGPDFPPLLAQFAILALLRLARPDTFTDDAFIHYRNALNLARGEGMVFNPGEAVLGTTAPLYAFLLGILHLVTRVPLPSLGPVLGFASDLGLSLLVLLWMARAGVPLAARHAALLLLTMEPWRLLYSTTGMETSLFLLVAAVAFEAIARGRPGVAGVALGLIGWIRPEGAAVWGAVACALAFPSMQDSRHARLGWSETARRIARAAAPAFVPAVFIASAIACMLLVQYGTILPQSVVAKARAPWYLAKGGAADSRMFVEFGRVSLFPILTGFHGSWMTLGDRINSSIQSVAQLFVMALGAWRLARPGVRERTIATCVAFFALFHHLFYCLTDPEVYHWYLVAPRFLSMFLAALGWWAAAEALAARARRGGAETRGARAARIGAGAGFAGVLGLAWASLAMDAPPYIFRGERIVERMAMRIRPAFDRETHYEQGARILNDWIGDRVETRTGLIEIGILGFHYRGRVLDAFGLVSPEALDLADPERAATIPESSREFPLGVFMLHRPEFLVTAPVFAWRETPEFLELYRPVEVPKLPLLFYVRRDVESEFDLVGSTGWGVEAKISVGGPARDREG